MSLSFDELDTRNYWHAVFSTTTWREFSDHGSKVAGFPLVRWGLVKRLQPGDYLLCYVTRICRWIGVLEVVSQPYNDETPIWSKPIFPCRVSVKPLITLTFETALPMKEIKDQIPLFREFKDQTRWGVFFQTSPFPWKNSDAEVVINALKKQAENPITRPCKLPDEKKFGTPRPPSA